jgi:hypothetical protein
LNHLPWPPPCPFYFSYFPDRVLCFLFGLASDHNPTSASQVAGVTGISTAPGPAWLFLYYALLILASGPLHLLFSHYLLLYISRIFGISEMLDVIPSLHTF